MYQWVILWNRDVVPKLALKWINIIFLLSSAVKGPGGKKSTVGRKRRNGHGVEVGFDFWFSKLAYEVQSWLHALWGRLALSSQDCKGQKGHSHFLLLCSPCFPFEGLWNPVELHAILYFAWGPFNTRFKGFGCVNPVISYFINWEVHNYLYQVSLDCKVVLYRAFTHGLCRHTGRGLRPSSAT